MREGGRGDVTIGEIGCRGGSSSSSRPYQRNLGDLQKYSVRENSFLFSRALFSGCLSHLFRTGGGVLYVFFRGRGVGG